MSDEKATKQVESLYEIVNKTIEEWIKKHCLEESTLKKTINKYLDAHLLDIIGRIFGFENRWGKWEVDNCNGRMDKSVVGQYLKDKTQSITKEWLDKQADGLLNFKLPPDAVESMKKEIIRNFNNEMSYKMRELAARKAEQFVADTLAKITMDDGKIKDAAKALEFISVFSKVAVDEDKKK